MRLPLFIQVLGEHCSQACIGMKNMSLLLTQKMASLNSRPIFHPALTNLANCSHFKDVWEHKAPMFQTHKHPFIYADVISVKSSLKLTCFLLNRNLYIQGNICGFLFNMANSIETALSVNGIGFECSVCQLKHIHSSLQGPFTQQCTVQVFINAITVYFYRL